MLNPTQDLTKDRFLIHHRYSSDEYLIDKKTYHYIMEYISSFRYSLYTIPDDEFVQCEKLIDPEHTEQCSIRINEIIFE